MTKHVFSIFMITLLMMICLSNSIQSQSQNQIPVDRDRLKTVMEKAELYEVADKEVTFLILENSRLKESLTKEKEAGQILKNELEAVSSAYDTTRFILFVLGVLILIYVVIKIRSR